MPCTHPPRQGDSGVPLHAPLNAHAGLREASALCVTLTPHTNRRSKCHSQIRGLHLRALRQNPFFTTTNHAVLRIQILSNRGLTFRPVRAPIQQGASFNLHKVEIPQSGLIDHSEFGGVLIRDVDFNGDSIVCGRNDGVVKPLKPVN